MDEENLSFPAVALRLKQTFEEHQTNFSAALEGLAQIEPLNRAAIARESQFDAEIEGTPAAEDIPWVTKTKAEFPENAKVREIIGLLRLRKSEISKAIGDCRRSLAMLSPTSTEAKGALEALNSLAIGKPAGNTPISDTEIVEDLQALVLLFKRLSDAKRRRSRVAPSGRQKRSGNVAITEKIRVLKKDGVRGAEAICKELDDFPRPTRAAWREFTWPEAYKRRQYQKAVVRWISGVH